MDIYAKARMKDEYLELQDKYTKLCAFLKRVEEGSSPIHDDYPVGELYKQQTAMRDYLDALKARIEFEDGGVQDA